MKTRLFSASIALLLGALPATGYSQGSTPPVGVLTYTLAKGTTSTIGVPVFGDIVFAGNSSGVSANTLSIATAPWAADQFAHAGAPYFVLMLTGGQTGRILLVTGNTTNSVTVDVGTTNLTGDATTPAFAATVGDRFEIFPGDTLASLFGDGSINPVQLQSGTSVFTADMVQIFDGVKWLSFYFNSTIGFWLNSAGGVASQNDVILYPDTGLLVGRRGPTTTISISGRAPQTNLVTRIAGGVTSSVAVRFPTDTTLGALNFSNPGTWVANDDVFLADRVNLFDGVKWVAYWKTTTGSLWKKAGGDGSDQSATVIPAGSSLLIQKQSGATGSASFFSQVIPYPVN